MQFQKINNLLDIYEITNLKLKRLYIYFLLIIHFKMYNIDILFNKMLVCKLLKYTNHKKINDSLLNTRTKLAYRF